MGGIWIRSQDKLSLCYCKRLIIEAQKQYDSDRACYVPTGKQYIRAVFNGEYEHGDSDLLGTYESVERAIEINDNIQRFIEDGISSSWETDIETRHGCFVYQMPAE